MLNVMKHYAVEIVYFVDFSQSKLPFSCPCETVSKLRGQQHTTPLKHGAFRNNCQPRMYEWKLMEQH